MDFISFIMLYSHKKYLISKSCMQITSGYIHQGITELSFTFTLNNSFDLKKNKVKSLLTIIHCWTWDDDCTRKCETKQVFKSLLADFRLDTPDFIKKLFKEATKCPIRDKAWRKSFEFVSKFYICLFFISAYICHFICR